MNTFGTSEMTTMDDRVRRLVVVSAGVSDPSSTRMLADRTAGKALQALQRSGEVTAQVVELAPIALGIARALVSGHLDDSVQEAVDKIAAADGLIVSTPVYKAGVSGLFKAFVDVLDDDLIIATPVILAATAGSERHAMVVDEQMRPLFAFLRALPVPTSLFAAPSDWASPAFGRRIERAAAELAHLVEAGSALASPIRAGTATSTASPAMPPARNSRWTTSTSVPT